MKKEVLNGSAKVVETATAAKCVRVPVPDNKSGKTMSYVRFFRYTGKLYTSIYLEKSCTCVWYMWQKLYNSDIDDLLTSCTSFVVANINGEKYRRVSVDLDKIEKVTF